ncbi:MAG: DUF5117 domain-containing protein, partial [Chitinophagaceae bacterium]|nr:DUF5117 domain-containing protein [Chitinophagaceae bacterium]
MNHKKLILAAGVTLLSFSMFAQRRTGTPPAAPAVADTTKKPTPPARPATGPKPYKEVITAKAVSDEGLFTVHKVEDKYYFEVPNSLLGRDILVVNRLSKAAAEMRAGGFFGYGGDQIGENVVRFEKGPDDRVFLREISYAEYSKDSSSPMFRSVSNSNVQPIVASFEVKAFGKDSASTVIDVTSFVASDNEVLYFNSGLKRALSIGGMQADKS